MKNASALVIPSLNEGFNFPLLEALAAGCPVLSSDIPVSKEIGANHATYFSNNAQSLLECIRNNIELNVFDSDYATIWIQENDVNVLPDENWYGELNISIIATDGYLQDSEIFVLIWSIEKLSASCT